MLFIKYNTGRVKCLQIPDMEHKSMSLTNAVEFISADGNELDYIMERFGVFATMGSNWQMTIPWNYKSKTQVWYGDIAKTILANF